MVTYLYITHWHWWGLAALLIIGEILAPCYYFMALGCAAAITGIVERLMPISGFRQLELFAILAVICLALAFWRKRSQLAHKPGK